MIVFQCQLTETRYYTCLYHSLRSMHVCENEMCDNASSVTHFATYHISNSSFHALISEQHVFHSQRKP